MLLAPLPAAAAAAAAIRPHATPAQAAAPHSASNAQLQQRTLTAQTVLVSADPSFWRARRDCRVPGGAAAPPARHWKLLRWSGETGQTAEAHPAFRRTKCVSQGQQSFWLMCLSWRQLCQECDRIGSGPVGTTVYTCMHAAPVPARQRSGGCRGGERGGTHSEGMLPPEPYKGCTGLVMVLQVIGREKGSSRTK